MALEKKVYFPFCYIYNTTGK